LICATVWGSLGILLPTGSGNACKPPTAGAAASAADLGLSSELTPWPMNATDNSGRAILRITMPAWLPGRSSNKPPLTDLIDPAAGGSAGLTAIWWIVCER
jgi:hypothetical protein